MGSREPVRPSRVLQVERTKGWEGGGWVAPCHRIVRQPLRPEGATMNLDARPSTKRALALAACALLAAACGGRNPAPDDAPAPQLVGTWRFVEFESSSDEIGTIRPDDPGKYTMTLEADGRVAMRLDCNRATGTWTADPPDGESGGFTFGPLAMTRAQCPQPSLDTLIARDAEYVRTYVLRGDRLYLNLMADGGNYVWERVGETGGRRRGR